MLCDHCGTALYQRNDDKEETIKKRIEVYQQESAPLIDYYRAKQKLRRLNADGAAEVILEEIVRMSQGLE
jgi:adenylate kinase